MDVRTEGVGTPRERRSFMVNVHGTAFELETPNVLAAVQAYFGDTSERQVMRLITMPNEPGQLSNAEGKKPMLSPDPGPEGGQ